MESKFLIAYFLLVLSSTSLNAQRNDSLRLKKSLKEIQVTEEAKRQDKLRDVTQDGLNAARKTEVLKLSNMNVNLQGNQARAALAGFTGLQIAENDGNGLQLNISTRGLNPNRSEHMNLRQNGVDMSADALGYPESYYTPPLVLVDRIEWIKGAASLQFGPQLGGLVNFVLKSPQLRPGFRLEAATGLASFNQVNGHLFFEKGWNKTGLLVFGQWRAGDGWRANSQYRQGTAYLAFKHHTNTGWQWEASYTYQRYLAQQSGGLTFAGFDEDPRQSVRSRNWFAINWQLGSVQVNKSFGNLNYQGRTFLTLAQRQAVGNLSRIFEFDRPGSSRQLLDGRFFNIGHESRLLWRHELSGRPAFWLTGIRLYRGDARQFQAEGSRGSDANFSAVGDTLNDYQNPGRNVAFFTEYLWRITSKWSATAGLRREQIRTGADGFYQLLVRDDAGNLISRLRQEDQLNRNRTVWLYGLGLSYQLGADNELYTSFCANYRPVTFSDLRIVNPNFVTDSLIQDERGWSFDLGWRRKKQSWRYEVSVFGLWYSNRIGTLIKLDPRVFTEYRFRTNIGGSRAVGAEFSAQVENRIGAFKTDWFLSGSVNYARYTGGVAEVVGNVVEYAPSWMLRSGFGISWKKWQLMLIGSGTGSQYGDATNAIQTVAATSGYMPAWAVLDLSIRYEVKRFSVQAGIQNLANHRYISRFAGGYPGPGILPGEGRSFWINCGVRVL